MPSGTAGADDGHDVNHGHFFAYISLDRFGIVPIWVEAGNFGQKVELKI